MGDIQHDERIIKSFAKLSKFQVEYEGQPYDCNRCDPGKGKCCGAQNDNYNNNLACQKCRCQHLYDVTDGSRTEKVYIHEGQCNDCDDSNFDINTCDFMDYLKNNLKANITDCSNALVNVGENSTIEDVSLRSECNIDNANTVSVLGSNASQPTASGGDFLDSLPFDKKYLFIGGGVLFVIFILFFIF